MAEKITISEQYFGNYKAPLDSKLTPVQNLEELYAATKRTQRYEGMTVVVIDDGLGEGQSEYWLVGGTTNSCWTKKKSAGTIKITGDDVDNE